MTPQADDNDAAWLRFLRAYAKGDHEDCLDSPSSSDQETGKAETLKNPEFHAELDVPLYDSSTDIDLSTARKVREFYKVNGFLAPPRSPKEDMRMQCIRDYDLAKTAQIANIQKAVELLSCYFPETVCTFSLFRDDAQHHVAAAGPPHLVDTLSLSIGTRVPPQISLCGHTILLGQGIKFVSDLANDWRYRENPWVQNGMKSYIGSVVRLQPDPTLPTTLPAKSTDQTHTVAIGALNICFLERRLEGISPEQTRVIERITDILEEQLRSTWQAQRHVKEVRARQAVSDYLESSLVRSIPALHEGSLASRDEGSTSGTGTGAGDKLDFQAEARHAINKIRAQLEEVDFSCILDLSSFQSQRTQSDGRADYVYDGRDPARMNVLASCDGSDTTSLTTSDAAKTMCNFLNEHHRHGQTTFVRGRDDASGLEPLLPEDTYSHLVMPLFSGGHALFAVIACSTDPSYSFNRGDSDFIRSMATVLKAVATQARAIEVEHKRTTVMSRFSHDLRTPLHGILGSVGLLKSSVDNEERGQAAELLNTLDAATKEMEKLMNDMLDEESSNRLDQSRRADTNAWAALQAQGQTSAMTPGSSYSTLSTFDFSHELRDALPASPSDSKPLSTPAAGPRPVTQGTAALSPIPEPLTPSNAEDTPKHMSVLVVEDDPVSRKLLAMAVKRAVRGVGVTQARDGVEGLTAFCNAHPHLVLTDVNMPIMDGITAAKAMRTVESAQGWKRSWIYTITGLGQADVQKRRDALNLTLDGWLVKGQHRMEDIQAIVKELDERRKERGDDDVQVDPTRRASR